MSLYYILIITLIIILMVLVAIYPLQVAALPVLAISLKFPSIFFAILINGMFLLSYFGQGFLSGYQTIGTVGLATLGTIIYRGKVSNYLPRKNNLLVIIVFLTFGLYLSMSLLWTDASNYGFFKVQGYWLGVFIPFVLLYEYLRKNIEKLNVISIICVVFSIIATVTLAIEYGGFSFTGRSTLDRVNPIWYGRYIGVGLIFAYYNCFASTKIRTNFEKNIWLIITIFLFLGLLMNGSRGPILSFIIGVLIIEIFFSKRLTNLYHKLSRAMLMLIIMLFGIVMLINFIPRFHLQNLNSDGNILERVQFIEESIQNFSSHPLIGWGIGGFSTSINSNDERIYPHNIFIEIGIELGLVGLLFLFFILYILFKDKKYLYSSNEGRVWSTLFIFFILNSCFSGDLFGNAAMWIPGAAMIQIKNYYHSNSC